MAQASLCFLDEGNTRVKWRSSGEVPVQCAQNLEQMVEKLDVSLSRQQTLVAASVRTGGAELRERLEPYFRRVEICQVKQDIADLHLCYENPADMGVDRWLAMVAVRKTTSDAFVLMDAGSAITIDLVDKRGCHQGGLIQPGLRAQQKSLAQLSERLAVHLSDTTDGPKIELGCSSRAALLNSAPYAAAAALTQIAQAAGVEPNRCFITGGDADLYREYFPSACFSGDLVLEGIAVLNSKGVHGS